MTVKDELTTVFEQVFDEENLTLTPEMTANDIEDWDSMSHVTMLMAVEDHFGIEFEQWEAMNLPDVGALIKLIEKKLQQAK